jgi:hypothetical protein
MPRSDDKDRGLVRAPGAHIAVAVAITIDTAVHSGSVGPKHISVVIDLGVRFVPFAIKRRRHDFDVAETIRCPVLDLADIRETQLPQGFRSRRSGRLGETPARASGSRPRRRSRESRKAPQCLRTRAVDRVALASPEFPEKVQPRGGTPTLTCRRGYR